MDTRYYLGMKNIPEIINKIKMLCDKAIYRTHMNLTSRGLNVCPLKESKIITKSQLKPCLDRSKYSSRGKLSFWRYFVLITRLLFSFESGGLCSTELSFCFGLSCSNLIISFVETNPDLISFIDLYSSCAIGPAKVTRHVLKVGSRLF